MDGLLEDAAILVASHPGQDLCDVISPDDSLLNRHHHAENRLARRPGPERRLHRRDLRTRSRYAGWRRVCAVPPTGFMEADTVELTLVARLGQPHVSERLNIPGQPCRFESRHAAEPGVWSEHCDCAPPGARPLNRTEVGDHAALRQVGPALSGDVGASLSAGDVALPELLQSHHSRLVLRDVCQLLAESSARHESNRGRLRLVGRPSDRYLWMRT